MDIRVDNLVAAIHKLRDFGYHHDRNIINDVKRSINAIFAPVYFCSNFEYTINTDKLPFGCVAFPKFINKEKDGSFSYVEITDFFIDGTPIVINNFNVELDSKMFDYGLTDEEVAQLILYNCYHLMNDVAPLKEIKQFIDTYYFKNANNFNIGLCCACKPVLEFGLCDALSQATSCLYVSDDIFEDPFLESLGLDGFKEMLNKVHSRIPGCEDESIRSPKLSMLEWCMRLLDNLDTEKVAAIRLMEKASSLTASVLYKNCFCSVKRSLEELFDTPVAFCEAANTYFNESKRHNSFIAALKYSGLREIENDLYEFQMRAKNAESENDVLYALKQINARLSILDDYIRTNPDDPELDRWIGVKMEYMDVRDVLAKKKLRKASYGIFVDYNALDQLDNEE